jgi:hypothetical protein
MKNKSYHLTLNHRPLTLTLTPPNQQWGYCFRCHAKKETRVISEKQVGLSWEEKIFCWSCALSNLYELEESNCEFENKKEVIKEIKEFLLKQKLPQPDKGQELLECYG